MSKSTYEELEAQVQKLASENAYLLPKAASELSNAWVLHKYWVGIHVALMHVREGRLHDGMVWLQNTVAGPGIDVPQLTEFAEIEAWAVEQQKDSISAVRALEIIKAEAPATDAALEEIRAQGVEMAVERLSKKFEGIGGIGAPVIALEHLASELRKDQEK
ncbi:hypothetical protein RJE46_10645 [Cedecea neteri]|uniref:hypothetical protein n=1 Tax=Cedecea neteri TaxID=158822 RepID=UPI002892E13A|nr:hypothetical protein [Cedecea neteri]WNJ81655.1 hypothetical protein RJE46_10645 [Cedecea neteri]